MRRGLIARSPVELPDAALESRLARVRAAMRERGLDALLVYTNNSRAAGVSWLTGFVPYWSEALLIVPRSGTPVLVAALSFRVKPWIERVSRLGEVLHSPRIGLKAAEHIAAIRADAAVGVVDFDALPAGIIDDVRSGGPRLTLSDASALFARLRAKADPAEIALAMHAGGIGLRALAAAQGDALNAMIGAVEGTARQLGAEEIYIAAAPDLDSDRRFIRIEGDKPLGRNFALRATVAYKGSWVRLVRLFGDAAPARDAMARFAEAAALLPSERGFAGFASWLVEGCRTTQPLDPLMGSALATPQRPLPGSLVSIQGVLPIGGRMVPLGAPALIGDDGETASLLVNPLFD